MSKKKGFTLIELMVVIAIIAVLAAVVTPQVFRQVEKGRIASIISDFKAIKQAGLAIAVDLGVFPAEGIWCTGPGFADNAAVPPPLMGRWDGPYLDRWPPANPWGGA